MLLRLFRPTHQALCKPTRGIDALRIYWLPFNYIILSHSIRNIYKRIKFASNPAVLDQDASAISTGVLITVGGDKVNSVTADAMAAAGVDFTATPQVVKAVGNKIIVAGLTAQDTIAAGNDFLGKLASR